MKKQRTLIDPRQVRGEGEPLTGYAARLDELATAMALGNQRFTSADIRNVFHLPNAVRAVATLRRQGYDIKQEFVKDGHGRYRWEYYMPPIDHDTLPPELRAAIQTDSKKNSKYNQINKENGLQQH